MLNVRPHYVPRRHQRLLLPRLEKGNRPEALGFLAGFGGLPKWIPFLDALARERTVIVPSLPGFPGGERGHTVLDNHLDWVLATHQLLFHEAGLDGADLVGSSVGGSLAVEVAAIWAQSVKRLALIAPFGLFDEKEPATDPWAQRAPELPGLLCADPARWEALKAEPEGQNWPEWSIEQTRASEAAARIFWPLGNTKLEKRLPLITAPTLLLWGEQDRIMPRSYADKFAARVADKTEIRVIPGAGHLAELDEPPTPSRPRSWPGPADTGREGSPMNGLSQILETGRGRAARDRVRLHRGAALAPGRVLLFRRCAGEPLLPAAARAASPSCCARIPARATARPSTRRAGSSSAKAATAG